MSENGQVVFGNTVIEYSVTRSSRRRKTVGITLDHGDGVLVAAPVDTPAEQLRQIVLKRAPWIIRHATDQVLSPRRKQFVSGESLPYLGRQVRILVESGKGRRMQVVFRHWEFRITVPEALVGDERRAAIEAAVVRWYRTRATEHLAERAEHWAKLAGWAPSKVLVRDQRQRWGSCSPDGVLRFNWRIVMAPPALMDYVVVHELVHLRVKAHSPVFWAEVARLMPDYGLRRARLKEMGPNLTI